MNDVLEPGIRERLWHEMRKDLAQFVPEIDHSDLLMCCCCGRFLPQEDFGLEHIIPKRAIKVDPVAVRSNPLLPANVRAKTLLLCKRQLVRKGLKIHNLGCNSWKGKYFDSLIADLITKPLDINVKLSTNHLIAAQILGYLAMVQQFGYIIVLASSGLALREQFFNPHRFTKRIGARHQIVLGGMPFTDPEEAIWANPFTFDFQDGLCYLTIRHFVVIAPATQNPATPIAKHLKIAPSKYKFRPQFGMSLD